MDSLLGRALIALSGANILLTVLMIGKHEKSLSSGSLKCAVRSFERSCLFVQFTYSLNQNQGTSPNFPEL